MNNSLESVHDLVGAYALNAVDDAERAAFESHLDECALCREELASFGGVLDALTDDAKDGLGDQAPAGLAERIGEQIALTPQVSVGDGDTASLPPVRDEIAKAPAAEVPASEAPAADLPGGEPEPEPEPDNVVPFERAVNAPGYATADERTHANPAGRRSRLPMLLAAAAAAVAVAAVGVGFLINGGSPDANVAAVDAVLEAPDAQVIDLGLGDATITVSAEAGGFAATGSAPDLPTGEEYQLWMVNADESVSPGPTFDAGDFETAVIADMSDVTGIAVTVEPTGGSEQPTSPIVANVEI